MYSKRIFMKDGKRLHRKDNMPRARHSSKRKWPSTPRHFSDPSQRLRNGKRYSLNDRLSFLMSRSNGYNRIASALAITKEYKDFKMNLKGSKIDCKWFKPYMSSNILPLSDRELLVWLDNHV